jgi:Protein of unknown function (DUF2933)
MKPQSGLDSGRFAWLRSKTGLVLLAFLAVAAFFLTTEHTAHFFGLLPYAFLLLCPLLHLFMHGGHGDRDAHTGHEGHAEGQTHPLQGDKP